ncbi:MAG TPA: HAD-IIIA family hydrolase [Baekduia sp.]|uniref:HAD-IIIA family hydrolase n=1 Tax=Baekduia sp. TaxID=2600305 RepID=UPI002BD921C5|nr:HAD-IIIA family hydrolase [Baekduia sp.]HMJ35064.1 HAD-IIIA family hydrolase [Baekduia sp.]
MTPLPRYDVVIPTAGRPSLDILLAALGAADGPLPERVIVVDDRTDAQAPLTPRVPAALGGRTVVLRSDGRGPATARNHGWRTGSAPWVAFLDDDVLPPPGWRVDLATDLTALGPRVAASQGCVRVPLPRNLAPTDWQRNVAGLEHARWATADTAFRRGALEAVGGFDERFPRAYREDSDLGVRLTARGLELVVGRRCVLHPVPAADRWVSLRKQAGNADDALMAALHGRGWRARAAAPAGRLGRHAVTTAAGAAALGAALAGARRTARVAASLWTAGTLELAWARIAPGPRTRDEITTMALTSVALPPVATGQRLAGRLRARRLLRAGGGPVAAPPLAVLLDRDGTLVHDVAYNKDPDLVLPLPAVRRALERLRAHGIRLAIVSNQSGISRGLMESADVEAVMARTAERLGPFDDMRWCPHGPDDGCACRKPAPGLLLAAAAALGVDPLRCAMIGDIGADMEAARAAGMRAILVPTADTRPEEVAAAPERAATFTAAVDLLLVGAPLRPAARPARANAAT